MGDLRKNFSRVEFDCGHCGARAPMGATLLDALQRLRDEVNRPLRIVSGYRCPTWNKQVGGIPRSMHRIGLAVDVPGGYCTVDQARRAGFHGVGVRRGRVVHLDMTPGRGFWTFAD